MKMTENGLGLPESLTTYEAMKWALGVLDGRRRDWNFTDRTGLSKDRLEWEKYFEAWDEATIKAFRMYLDLFDGNESEGEA